MSSPLPRSLVSMDSSTRIDDPFLKLPRPFVRALIDNGIENLGEAWATSESDLLAASGCLVRSRSLSLVASQERM